MTDTVLTEARDGVLVVTLNRPEVMNAVNAELARELLDAMRRLDGDPSLAVGVIAGAGPGFCAGMDLKAFIDEGAPDDLRTFFRTGAVKPLVAAVEGFALAGGLEIALTCDLIVAAKGAKFGLPETKVGLVAAGGGLLRLPARLPFSMAMEAALTGQSFLAEDGARYGLLARLVEPGGALAAALDLAQRIARNAPLAVAATKRLVRDGRGVMEADYWAMEDEVAHPVFSSEDAAEGARAFVEKRPAAWTGR